MEKVHIDNILLACYKFRDDVMDLATWEFTSRKAAQAELKQELERLGLAKYIEGL